jgi:ribonuclease T1
MQSRYLRILGSALVLLVAFVVLFGTRGRAGTSPTSTGARPTTTLAAAVSTPGATATPTPRRIDPTTTPTPRGQAAQPTANDGLPTIDFAKLPPEAQETIRLIDQDGPFPYDRDGIVFENRERLLPQRASAYYHEYTVITPGSNDRGARRVIAGQGGELYYTDDHYESFKRVRR